jgi:hypothetical protein
MLLWLAGCAAGAGAGSGVGAGAVFSTGGISGVLAEAGFGVGVMRAGASPVSEARVVLVRLALELRVMTGFAAAALSVSAVLALD